MRSARPKIYVFRDLVELRGCVTAGDDEWVAILGLLNDSEGLFAAAAGKFGLAAACVDQEILRDTKREEPSCRGYAAGGETSASRE